MSTSFPYLKIAREFGVDYGLVVRLSDMHGTPEQVDIDAETLLRTFGPGRAIDISNAISAAMEAERDRRRDVAHGRA